MKSLTFCFRFLWPVPWLYTRKYRHVLLFIFSTYLLQHCQPQSAQEHSHVPAGKTQEKYPATAQVHVRYAHGFDIIYHDHYKILQLLLAQDTVRYLLLPSGVPRPEKVKADQVIHIPVQKVITQSTTHIGLIAFLNAEHIITGIDEADYVYNQKIQQAVAEGKIEEVGGGENLNMEMVMALAPDLLMVSGMPGTTLERYQSVIDAGVPVLVNTEWMESSLLAKAEWVKLIAALTNQELLAEKRFSTLEVQYDSIAALAAQVKNKPEIISGSPFQDAWYVPGGNSYRSHLFQEAGGTWPWAEDTSAISILVSFETMYAYGLKAGYWLNPGQVRSKQELLAQDARFADFRSFRNGQVYNNNKRMNEKGLGNDYFESGIVHPQWILSDIVKILHPDLLSDDTLYYYQKMP